MAARDSEIEAALHGIAWSDRQVSLHRPRVIYRGITCNMAVQLSTRCTVNGDGNCRPRARQSSRAGDIAIGAGEPAGAERSRCILRGGAASCFKINIT